VYQSSKAFSMCYERKGKRRNRILLLLNGIIVCCALREMMVAYD